MNGMKAASSIRTPQSEIPNRMVVNFEEELAGKKN